MTEPYQLSPISSYIWDFKYQMKTQSGDPIDQTIEDTWLRVAHGVAQAEELADRERWAKKFYDAMHGFKLLPAGRILAGAGTDRSVTMNNCYCLGRIPDSIDGIFNALREAALTLKTGGGIGYDFSTIRYKGAPVEGVAADASGPISFMNCWDTMCRTLLAAGGRRGAMMGTLRADHPDVFEFVKAKQTAGVLTQFNVSVLIPDALIAAVDADGPWDLVWDGRVIRTVRARDLWDAIMRATYNYAEPGVIFIDRVNRENNLNYCETIYTTNPCSEQPLPPYGACCLGSVNLAALVRDPFTPSARIDEEKLRGLVGIAVRFLDDVVSVSKYPLRVQQDEAFSKRRIGLGVTGLADALAMMGVRYGSPQALFIHHAIQSQIMTEAYVASSDLARARGAFPLWDAERFNRSNLEKLHPNIVKVILKHGLRNSHLISIAPTGTISMLADNVSSGIEPIFSLSARRKVLNKDGGHDAIQVHDHAYGRFQSIISPLAVVERFRDVWVTSDQLSPEEHLQHLTVAQMWNDSSTSKTINLPTSISFDDFKDIYRRAYELGCKGCTTYRSSGVRGAVLESLDAGSSVAPPRTEDIGQAGAGDRVETSPTTRSAQPAPAALTSRPSELPGTTYKLKWPGEDAALYFVVNDLVDGDERRLYEVFMISKNPAHYPWWSALTRMISAIYRRGGDVSFVAEELLQVFDPRGGQWVDRSYVPSLPALLGHVLRRHVDPSRATGRPTVTELEALLGEPEVRVAVNEDGSVTGAETCPACHVPAYVHQEGCGTCRSCGYSNCG